MKPKSAIAGVVSVLSTNIYGLAAAIALAAFAGTLPAKAQTVPTGFVDDPNIPVIAASVSGPGATYLLNLDESISYLSQGSISVGCPALNQQPFVTGTGVEQNLIYDQTANLLYIMSELPDHNAGILAETPDPAGNCKPSPAVELAGGLNYAQSMASDAAKSSLYVVASYQGGSPDQLFVLNTSSFSIYSSTNPPPSFLLDYGSSYGQVVVDPSSHLAYVPEYGLGASSGGGPGFWVYDPSQNKLVRVLGYIDPTTNAQVDVSDLAIFAEGNGKIVIVNSNPTPSSTFQPNTLLVLDTTQFSFFSNTQAGSGFSAGVYVKPPTAAIVQYPRISQFSNISAASFDPVHGVVYVAAYLENSSNLILPQGLLMGYTLATPALPETLYSDHVAQPVTSSSSSTTTIYAGWGQLLRRLSNSAQFHYAA